MKLEDIDRLRCLHAEHDAPSFTIGAGFSTVDEFDTLLALAEECLKRREVAGTTGDKDLDRLWEMLGESPSGYGWGYSPKTGRVSFNAENRRYTTTIASDVEPHNGRLLVTLRELAGKLLHMAESERYWNRLGPEIMEGWKRRQTLANWALANPEVWDEEPVDGACYYTESGPIKILGGEAFYPGNECGFAIEQPTDPRGFLRVRRPTPWPEES